MPLSSAPQDNPTAATSAAGSAPAAAPAATRNPNSVFFQAHRGGLGEVPENTLETYLYAWSLGGIPEADINTTVDGVVVCLHDDTLARTTNAPEPVRNADISTLTFEEIRRHDAGVHFGPAFAGQKVPSLSEALRQLKGHPERQIYLDLKTVDLDKLGAEIQELGVGRQVIFCHNRQENLIRFSHIAPEVRTMLWIGGKPEAIKAAFEKARQSGYEGLNQIQLHLHRDKTRDGIAYQIDDAFLRYALDETRKAGLDLEVLPFEFDDASLHALLDLGIRWYANDYPKKFADSVRRWNAEALPAP